MGRRLQMTAVRRYELRLRGWDNSIEESPHCSTTTRAREASDLFAIGKENQCRTGENAMFANGFGFIPGIDSCEFDSE